MCIDTLPKPRARCGQALADAAGAAVAAAPLTITHEPTMQAAEHNVEPRDRPVGATATAIELKSSPRYIPAPSLALSRFTYEVERGAFLKLGFTDDRVFTVISEDGAEIWATKLGNLPADDTIFIRVG